MTNLRFVIHEHIADRAGWHHDLRLEMPDGTVRSWAVPKGVPTTVGVQRLAIEGPLHTLADLEFEGRIEEGYGKGTLSIVETGTYVLHGLHPNRVTFELSDDGYEGRYALIKFRENWLLTLMLERHAANIV